MVDRNGNPLTNEQVREKVVNRVKSYFLDFWLMILTAVGNVPLHFVRRFFYLLSGIKIGSKSTIHCWARFYNPAHIEIGNGTIIGDNCFLDGRDKLIIGDNVDIASQVLIYNSEHDINSADFYADKTSPVEIGDYVFIGPRVVILPGVKIGRGAVVAAGAVVTKDVPDYKIYAGIPAHEIGERSVQNLHYRLGRFKLFQ
jgi:maltose O-acetyltransferase